MMGTSLIGSLLESCLGKQDHPASSRRLRLIISLVPNIRIGPDVRVAPGPAELAARRASQLVMEADDAAMAQFRHSLDISTPHRNGHFRGHSSSVDFGLSPDFSGAMASTPHGSEVRNRLRHRKSFSLPSINPIDFADVRRSFDDCGRDGTPQRPGDSGAVGDMGIDLPPVPAHMSRRDLSRVTERDEANESSLMRETINDMGQAILALSSPVSKGDTTASDVSSRMDLADLAPIILHGDKLNASVSSSIRSEEELMAEEMEAVLAMDTPTRAEFVISPPASSYASSMGGRDSRASLRTTRSRMSMDDIPPVPHSRFSTVHTPVPTQTNFDQFTDAEEPQEPAQDVSLEMSELGSQYGSPLSHATSLPSMAYAHPHPPPVHYSTSIPNFSRPAQITSAHPPVPVKQLQMHRPTKSTETIASDATHWTTTDAESDASPLRVTEEFTLSRHEVMRLQQLKERRYQMDQTLQHAKSKQCGESEENRSKSALGHRDQERQKRKEVEKKPRRELRPLELAERAENRLSMPLPQPPNRVSMFVDTQKAQASLESDKIGKKGQRASRGRRIEERMGR